MARQARTVEGLGYRGMQQANAARRDRLSKTDRAALKQQGFRNVGWDNVICLSQRLDELLNKPELDQSDLPSLDSLFLEADRIGNVYQSAEEIAAFNQALAEASSAVDEAIEAHFPDNEVEIVHFQSGPSPGRSAKRKPRR
jgi:hypothetical protein